MTKTGIPGSTQGKPPRWKRQQDVQAGRFYMADTGDGFLAAIVSQDQTPQGLLWHISVSGARGGMG